MRAQVQQSLFRASIRIERRSRYAVGVDAALLSRTFPNIEVRVINISETGCLFRSNLALPVGASILLTIPDIGSHRAVVRRVDGDDCGASFRTPVGKREMTLLRAAGAARDSGPNDVLRGTRKLLAVLQARLGA
jgi:hypothetical protein